VRLARWSEGIPRHLRRHRQERAYDLPSDVVGLLPRIRELAGDPRPVDCKKLHADKDRWRIRVGNYSVVYAIDDGRKTVDISRIAHRKEVYE
jgi:mRNA interferase RelE/StbE